MYCPSCGSENANGAKFCQNCGKSLSILTQSHASAPAKKKRGWVKWVVLIVCAIVLYDIFTDGEDSAVETMSPLEIEKFKAETERIPYEDLARNPKEHEGKKVVFTGEVVQVLESRKNVIYRINVTPKEFGLYTDAVYVTYRRQDDSESRILEDDIVIFWGTSKGLVTYETVLGNDHTVPRVEAVAIELTKRP